MAFLPETETYDEGVYLIETTDPVVGGVDGISNKPQKNLANRTKYLKKRVDDLELLKAPLASPTFTGQPKAPTPSTSDETTRVATTLFVKNKIKALAVTSIDGSDAGDVQLADLATFARQLTGSGYQCFPGGLMIQWCTKDVVVPDGAGSSAEAEIAWPLAFASFFSAFVSFADVNNLEAAEHLFALRTQTRYGASARLTRVFGTNAGNDQVVRVQFMGIGRWQ